MTDRRTGQGGPDQTPDAEPPPASWHGVAPPPFPPEHTQPLETRPARNPDVVPDWWSSPFSTYPGPEGGHLGSAGPDPVGTPRPATTDPAGVGAGPAGWMGGAPAAAAGAAPTTSRRRGGTGGVVALALVSGLLGGGTVVAAERLLERSTPSTVGPALPAPGPGSTARPEGSIAKTAATALPSVVTIKIKAPAGSGTGSGFVIDTQGHLLTNNHVVAAAGAAGTITVQLSNGTTLPAQVVGRDASYDLAVLKVSAEGLKPLPFGRSTDVVVGDGVIAVGAPLGLDATVTSGIVSALNRPVTAGDGTEQSFINAIQTDAAINPGNSGGPLLDMSGRVIGVNSAIARVPGSASGSGGNIGVGFAIPGDQAAKTAQQLIATGKAEHPVLGVRVDRAFDGDGARIAPSAGVQPGSAADRAGLRDGDVIVELDGRRVPNADALIVAVRARSVGDTVRLKVQRGSQTLELAMTLQAATT